MMRAVPHHRPRRNRELWGGRLSVTKPNIADQHDEHENGRRPILSETYQERLYSAVKGPSYPSMVIAGVRRRSSLAQLFVKRAARVSQVEGKTLIQAG